MACDLLENEYGYDDARFKKDVDENFHCSICFNVLKEPRMCRNNEHIFCLACITRNLNENSETCPECSESLSVDTLRRAPRVVNNYLSELEIKCDFASRGCPEYIRVEALNVHVASCGFAPVRCPNEECGMEINKRDKVHHETEVCEYRKVKCHNCEHLQELVVGLVEMNTETNEKVETLKNNMTQELKKLDTVKNSLSKVNKDIAGLKGTMTQILKKLDRLEFMRVPPFPNQPYTAHNRTMLPGAYGSVSMPTSVLRHVKHGAAAASQIRQIPEQPIAPHQDVLLNPSILAQASAADQKQMLGERLFPLIQQTHPDLAGKITGMILEVDNSEILHMLEFRDALAAKVKEAVSVLQAHEQREPQHRPKKR